MITAVDAATSEYTGLAVFDGDAPPVLHRIACFPTDYDRTYLERVRPILLEVLATPGPHILAVERPPVTAHKGQGPRIGQAAIGYPIGYLSGLVAHDFVVAGHTVERVDVSPWRATLLLTAARLGIQIEAELPRGMLRPLTRDGDGHLVATWDGCEHRRVTSVPELDSGRLMTCPTCTDAALDKSDQWKARACNFVRQRWPRAYASVRAEAMRAAKKTHPDHRYAGLADACEAACIGLHVREVTAGRVDPPLARRSGQGRGPRRGRGAPRW